ncbi:MAG TPA: VOC family protein [Gemmatimonadaceae bacterium]|nr:VOC family protein [Gemmatimonadaceae bacterium]
MPIDGVLETCLYANDLDAAERFYAGVLGLAIDARVPERHVFFRCGPAMLLVFDAERTLAAPGQVGGTPVPAHGARGPGHVCFRIGTDELGQWRERLRAAGVAIEAEIAWPRGGASIYVRDPAGNSVELAPAEIWGLPD